MAHADLTAAVACVESLIATPLPAQHIVLVVNVPDAVPATAFLQLPDRVHVVRNDTVMGYGANLNAGARLLPPACDLLLLANDDTLFSRGALGTLVAEISSRPRAAVAAPAFVYRDGAQQPSAFSFPSVVSELADATLLPAFARRTRNTTACTTHVVDWVLGAALLARRGAFESVGGFDPEYFLYMEETDLCLRLKHAGWDTIFCPTANVVHLYGHSTSGAAPELTRSKARYVRQHWTRRQRVLLRSALPLTLLWNVVYAALRAIISPRRDREIIAPVLAAWRGRALLRPRTRLGRSRTSAPDRLV